MVRGRNSGFRASQAHGGIPGGKLARKLSRATCSQVRLWSPSGLREALDPVGHVGHIHRPLRAGLGAAPAEVPRGHRFRRNQRFFGPFGNRDVRGGALFVNVHRGSPGIFKIEFCENARKRGRTVTTVCPGEILGVGGCGHAELSVSMHPHARHRRASRSFPDQFGRLCADEVPRGPRCCRNEILILL